MFSSETSLLERAHPWIGDTITICGSQKEDKLGFCCFTKIVFYLSIIAEDGPDDLFFDDVLLLDPDDDVDEVSPSDTRILVLVKDSSHSSFGRNEEHVSFLLQIGSSL